MQLAAQLFEGGPTGFEVLDAEYYAVDAPVGEEAVETRTDALEARSEGTGIEAAAEQAAPRRLELGEGAGHRNPDEVRGTPKGAPGVAQEAHEVDQSVYEQAHRTVMLHLRAAADCDRLFQEWLLM